MKKKVDSPDISYVVSCFNRPRLLPVCLYSLSVQTHRDFEVIVTDNAIDNAVASQHCRAVTRMEDSRFRYFRTAGKILVSDCYWSAEWGIKHHAQGKWYCFPCDDSYYAPEFGQRMLTAAYRENWDFVVCGSVVVGPEASGGSGYRVWDMQIGRTIKTSFMIKASRFTEFYAKPVAENAAAGVDYSFGAHLVRSGVPWGIVPEVMLVHN